MHHASDAGANLVFALNLGSHEVFPASPYHLYLFMRPYGQNPEESS